MPAISELRMTRTHCHAEAVIELWGKPPTTLMKAFLADFSQDECSTLSDDVVKILGTKSVRIFDTMEELTHFLISYPAVISKCTVIQR